LTSVLKGKTFYFGMPKHKENFDSMPPKFLENCPVCGMLVSKKEADIDPVCGMTVDKEKAKEAGLTAPFYGETFYFCKAMCKNRFKEKPEAFLKLVPLVKSGDEEIRH